MRRLVALLLLAAGCAPGRPSAVPPDAEFLVATDDSTFWVRADREGVRLRAAPLVLARVGGRFVELYVADDDRMFAEATFFGARVYARDLERGDSSAVFRDPMVPPLASAWMEAHPDDTPLDPDEPEPEHPVTRASVDIAFVDVTGHWLSIEVHADLAPRGTELVHESRRAVLDLRSGRLVPLRELATPSDPAQLLVGARAALRAARDSATRLRDARGAEAVRAIARLVVDSTNFSLAAVRDEPAVQFLASAGGMTADGNGLLLPPLLLPQVPWLTVEMRDARPTSAAEPEPGRRVERWSRAAYEVLARSDTGAEVLQLAIRDSARREFPVGFVQGTVRRIYWLDSAPVDAAARRALSRAFDDASYYSELTRTVRWSGRTVAPRAASRVAMAAARPPARSVLLRPRPHSPIRPRA